MEIKLTHEELAKKKLFVATPMYGGMCGGMYTKSMADLTAICTRYNIELQFFALFNESLITRARNYCVDEFLRSKMDYLLFLDADIGFDPGDVIAMMGIMTDDSPYDVLCAPYPKKCISWEKIVQAVNSGVCGPNDENPQVLDNFVGDFVFNPKSGTGNIPIGEPCEILEGGTGFMMIRRSTLVKFQESFPQYMYRPDHVRTEHFDGSREICQFFQAEIDVPDLNVFKNRVVMALEKTKEAEDTKVLAGLQADLTTLLEEYNNAFSRSSKRYLSEDYWFSQKIQQIGLHIWLCPWMKTNHTGTMVYGGSLADLAGIGASPTAEISKLGKKNK